MGPPRELISAGPYASRAATAIGFIEQMIDYCKANSPLPEAITAARWAPPRRSWPARWPAASPARRSTSTRATTPWARPWIALGLVAPVRGG